MPGMSHTTLGAHLGVNQKRVARIEAARGVTGFEQISRFVSALGAGLVILDSGVSISEDSGTAGKAVGKKSDRKARLPKRGSRQMGEGWRPHQESNLD